MFREGPKKAFIFLSLSRIIYNYGSSIRGEGGILPRDEEGIAFRKEGSDRVDSKKLLPMQEVSWNGFV